jgi:hypothetical protein
MPTIAASITEAAGAVAAQSISAVFARVIDEPALALATASRHVVADRSCDEAGAANAVVTRVVLVTGALTEDANAQANQSANFDVLITEGVSAVDVQTASMIAAVERTEAADASDLDSQGIFVTRAEAGAASVSATQNRVTARTMKLSRRKWWRPLLRRSFRQRKTS